MPVCRAMLETRFPEGGFELVFVSADGSHPARLNGHAVLPQQEFLTAEQFDRYYSIAINDSRVRQGIVKIIGSQAQPFSIVAVNYHQGDACDVGEGAILLPFTSITSNVRIGRYFHANHYARVAHDCAIGDFVTFAPSVQCNGGVVIENHVYVGSGAVIRQSLPGDPIVIGEGALIGMGSVVTKSVPPFTIVAGNPARIIRTIDPDY
jgi:sugar O-acyltransferase (sialic acid O-acetyltransferase NeuD family)